MLAGDSSEFALLYSLVIALDRILDRIGHCNLVVLFFPECRNKKREFFQGCLRHNYRKLKKLFYVNSIIYSHISVIIFLGCYCVFYLFLGDL